MPKSFCAKARVCCDAKRITGDGELGAADFLTTEEIAHRLDGGVLIVQVGLEVKFHGSALQAAHIFQPVLLEDGGEIGFGNVVSKGAVAEDHGASRPQGPVACASATMPSASGSTSAAAIFSGEANK